MTSETPSISVRLADCAAAFSGFAPYGRSAAGKGDHFLPCVAAKALQAGDFNLDEIESLIVPDSTQMLPYRLAIDDVVIIARGTSFRSAVWENEMEGAILGPNLLAIRLQEHTTIGPYTLQAYLDSPKGKALLHSLCQGSSVPALYPHQVLQLIFNIPSRGVMSKTEELCRLHYGSRKRAALAMRKRSAIVETAVVQLLTQKNILEVEYDTAINA